MLRYALLLVIIAAAIAVFLPLIRKRRRRREEDFDEDDPAEAKAAEPALLPAGATPRDERALEPNEVFRRFYELAFQLPLGVPVGRHEHVAKVASEALDNMSTDPRYAPRRPMLLPQLLKAVNDPEASRHEIVKIVMQDPALAGTLLKLANSPMYRVGTHHVENIDRALAMLGTDGVRSLVAATLIQPVFRVKGGRFPHFPETVWDHSLRCGAAAEVHAAIVEDADPFAAQLLGLIHGLATIVVFRAAVDAYDAFPDLKPEPVNIATLMRSRAPEVARRIAEDWGLSGRVLSALEDQDPDLPMHSPTPLGRSLHFGRLVAALVLLHADGRIDDLTARASMLGHGATEAQIKRIWMRLSGDAGPH